MGTLSKVLLASLAALTACSGGSATSIVVVDGLVGPGSAVSITVDGLPTQLDGGQVFINATDALVRRVRLEGNDPYLVEGDKVSIDLTGAPTLCRPVLVTNLGRALEPDAVDSPTPREITNYDDFEVNGSIAIVGDCSGAIITIE